MNRSVWRSVWKACASAAFIVAVFSTGAFAQGGSTAASIIGTVTDSSGGVIPGATVLVKNNATGIEFNATTNDQGSFTVPAVDPGTYTVTVTLMGFKTAVVNDVTVNAATPASVRVRLEVGGLEETVVVTGGSEIIQTQSAAVTTTLDTNQILKLPTGSRSALDFITSLPGVNTPGSNRNSTINGLPQSSINITIDGISAQDNHLKTGDGFFARVSPRLDAMEEVTVSSAAQDAANTGQGAVQIRFVTRSGSNEYTGSGYYYLRHYSLDANSWFNNRDGVSKDEDVLYQPGARLGGPIIIPGLWNGRNKAFFFVNYEESRSPGQNTETRRVLHPRAEDGIFRYTTSGGAVREVNVLDLAASNGFIGTPDPTIRQLVADMRSAVSGGPLRDLDDPLLQEFRYQYDRKGVTRYPTVRIDFNLTDRHRLSGSMNYTDLLSTPDTTNNREPAFPGFPNTGNQHSDRYTAQINLRSTLTGNLVNEFKVGGSGGATLFSPEIGPAQFSGTSIADQGGFLLDINDMGISNPSTTGSYSAREATTRIIENTLSWLKGSHNVQAGFAFTQADTWIENQRHVPTITFGVHEDDPIDSLFRTTNFPGASNSQLNDARELYAMLTGRVDSIGGELRLDENTDEYRYLGLGVQRARLRDYGFFVADTWRWKPNLTLNLGLRYELQVPFTSLNNSYSKATIADVCGISGIAENGACNFFSPVPRTTHTGQFVQYSKGEAAYNTDRNNFAPSIGIAWTLGGQSGLLGGIFGSNDADSVLRAGYTLGYNRPGTSDFTGRIDDNPGIAQSANRTHSLDNLGTPGSILFRNRGDLGPPEFSTTRQYPMTDVVTGDILAFDPNLQVPYSQTWTGGWQRKLTRDTAVEIRYVGTRSLQSWQNYNYNEINIIENGFLDEFKLAQQNLQANMAANRGANFRYYGPGTGTSPLPIFLAYFSGRTDVDNPAAYGSSNFSSSTFVNELAMFNPDPHGMANSLDSAASRRANAIEAGLPANFLVANPNYLGGAEIVGNGGYTKYNSMQLELRKRLSAGLQFNASYVFGKAYTSSRYSLRTPRVKTMDGGTEGGVVHAFKTNWTYELPFGQGHRFGSGVGPVLDRIIGGWSFDGIARIQSGRMLDFGNVRLVGMSVDDLQDMFKLRFDDAGRVVYMLPQDVIDETVKAWSVSATSPTGYGSQGPPSGRYIAPANGPDCIEVAQGFGDCGLRSVVVTGPKLVRFDMSVVKRVPIKGRVNAEFRAELLNAFNTPWFSPVTGTGNNPDNFRVTGASGGREVQLVWRINW
ncbi:MAG TPA: TonB-dependent receptor [Vicinamibacterales bacterium]